ncbi:NUDIX hydrolase [Clostridium culturomicium]|uniref:NUDIX hydrolase n=1 Tax=Clostridium culturomicium TaxID=1499683 RepID=UPI00058C27D1|nr:NUDIX hydrolase [Clostridium culturomicium]
MGWQEDIRKYKPFNEQEKKDKESIIYAINNFNNLLTRENTLAHITSSGYIVNKDRTKVLMIHHNIYNTWAWTGGHADGDSDLLRVAIKEAIEETGVKNIKPITSEILSVDVIEVLGHVKRGVYVSAHLHLNVCYLLEADEADELIIKADENSGVKWLPMEELHNYSSEPHMVKLYNKFNEKIKLNWN